VPVIDFETLFHQLNGSEDSGFTAIHSPVHHTPGGVLYLLTPGVALLARPNVHLGVLTGFLSGFDPSLHFAEYLDDPTKLPSNLRGMALYSSTRPLVCCSMESRAALLMNWYATGLFQLTTSS